VSTHPGFGGTFFVVPTPFDEDGSLDLEGVRRLTDAALSWGADGLTVMGLTSEADMLTEEERGSALGAISETVGGRVPVVVGCTAGDADQVVAFMSQARAHGASGAMVAAVRGTEDLPSFYAECAERGGLPLVIQDEPAATGVPIPTNLLYACLRMAGAVTVKLEAPPTAPKIRALLELGPDLRLFGGLGGAYALAELRAGACGTMTGFAFPEIMRAIRLAAESDDWPAAGALYDRYLPLIQFEAQPVLSLPVRKELLRRRGVIASARCRREHRGLDDGTLREIDDLLARLDIWPGTESFSPAAPPRS
jgi:4-hydroxy-tetrahydrodipicolinate synthase